MTVTQAPYPGLAVSVFTATFESPLSETPSPDAALSALAADAEAPLQRDEEVRTAVRNLLRQRGYKPTGRGKPASEYLVRASLDGGVGSINAAVDICNAVSLHSGFPISVVDLDLTTAPLRIDVGAADAKYVFNASGQTIKLDGLLCLFDADGPCANAVRDSQRTKTSDATTRTLSVIWAPEEHADRLGAATRWYAALLAAAGAQMGAVAVEVADEV